MMKINCLVVYDEPVARSIIRNYCGHLPFLNIIGECGNALDAKAFLSTHKTDLLFLDINMPVLNGISFLNTLKDRPQVIFTTAYQEYAVNAFDLAVEDRIRIESKAMVTLRPAGQGNFVLAFHRHPSLAEFAVISHRSQPTQLIEILHPMVADRFGDQ